LNLKF